MLVARTPQDLSPAAGNVFVPTMGALHAGHAALIRRGAALARERGLRTGCVVSIFVNPTQFNDPADLARYPRPLEADLELCRAAGASAVFTPAVETMYPPGAGVPVPPLPPAATLPGLEDAHRPGHFAGVAQVVMRLFDLVRPAVAVFGEKDWQQLAVVRAVTAEQGRTIDIIGHPTVREVDGLAMSSRNVFLTPQQRAASAAISHALRQAGRQDSVGAAELLMRRVIERAGLAVEYAVVRDAATLLPVPATTGNPPPRGVGLRSLVAARAGTTRLIDNGAWPGGW